MKPMYIRWGGKKQVDPSAEDTYGPPPGYPGHQPAGAWKADAPRVQFPTTIPAGSSGQSSMATMSTLSYGAALSQPSTMTLTMDDESSSSSSSSSEDERKKKKRKKKEKKKRKKAKKAAKKAAELEESPIMGSFNAPPLGSQLTIPGMPQMSTFQPPLPAGPPPDSGTSSDDDSAFIFCLR